MKTRGGGSEDSIVWFVAFLFIAFFLYRMSARPSYDYYGSESHDLHYNQLEEDWYTQQQETHEAEIRPQQQEDEYEQSEPIQQTNPKCLVGYTGDYMCSGNYIQRKWQDSDCNIEWLRDEYCDYGCENNKCVPCYDSDGGRAYYERGYIEYAGYKEYDKCDWVAGFEGYLMETSCSNFLEYYRCPYGCSDGKCNTEPEPEPIDKDEPEPENEMICSPTTLRCTGNWRERCNNDGSEWVSLEYCSYMCDPRGCVIPPKEPEDEVLEVIIVLDGDTIELNTGERVRLIGINAPEFGETCYEEAKHKLEYILSTGELVLDSDVEDKDRYDRLLRYLYVGDTFVNLKMVEWGFAYDYPYEPNTKYAGLFEQAEGTAEEEELGCLWQRAAADYILDGCIYILESEFHFNAAGDDNYNLNDEYVTLRNKCSYPIEPDSWKISDSSSYNKYTLPSFTLQADSYFTLYTGIGTNTNSVLFWGRTSGDYAAVWNNGGDTLFLRDSEGNLVLMYAYDGY